MMNLKLCCRRGDYRQCNEKEVGLIDQYNIPKVLKSFLHDVPVSTFENGCVTIFSGEIIFDFEELLEDFGDDLYGGMLLIGCFIDGNPIYIKGIEDDKLVLLTRENSDFFHLSGTLNERAEKGLHLLNFKLDEFFELALRDDFSDLCSWG